MNQILKEFLFKLDILAPFFTLLYAWLLPTKKGYGSSLANRMLLAYLVLESVLNALAGYLQYKTFTNLWVYHVNCQLTHLVFSFYFFRTLKRKKLLITGLSLFIMANVILAMTKQPYHSFPSYSYALSSFILVVYALLFFNRVIEKIPTAHILALKEFWLNTGILTYFGSAFLIFISYQYLSDTDPRDVYILWQVHNIFLALSCILFAKAIKSRQWIHSSLLY